MGTVGSSERAIHGVADSAPAEHGSVRARLVSVPAVNQQATRRTGQGGKAFQPGKPVSRDGAPGGLGANGISRFLDNWESRRCRGERRAVAAAQAGDMRRWHRPG